MAAFDFQSGVQGASAGAAVGGPAAPYTAIAGFVIGGFVGGHKKAKAKQKYKKKLKRYKREYQELTSPQGYNKIVQGLLPGQRNLIAAGPGSQMQSNIDTSLARGGFSGTGLGEAARAIGYVAPEVAALNLSNDLGLPVWEQKIEAFKALAASEGMNEAIGGVPNPPYAVNKPFGSANEAINMLGTYGGGMSMLGKGSTSKAFANTYSNQAIADIPMGTYGGFTGGYPTGMNSNLGYTSSAPLDFSSIYNPYPGYSHGMRT